MLLILSARPTRRALLHVGVVARTEEAEAGSSPFLFPSPSFRVCHPLIRLLPRFFSLSSRSVATVHLRIFKSLRVAQAIPWFPSSACARIFRRVHLECRNSGCFIGSLFVAVSFSRSCDVALRYTAGVAPSIRVRAACAPFSGPFLSPFLFLRPSASLFLQCPRNILLLYPRSAEHPRSNKWPPSGRLV